MLEDLWLMRLITVAVTGSDICQVAAGGLRATEAPKLRLCVAIL